MSETNTNCNTYHLKVNVLEILVMFLLIHMIKIEGYEDQNKGKKKAFAATIPSLTMFGEGMRKSHFSQVFSSSHKKNHINRS